MPIPTEEQIQKANLQIVELADGIIQKDHETDPSPQIDDMTELAELLVDRIRNNYDAVVGVTGPEGEGKSTFTKLFSAVIARRQNQPYSLVDNVLYAPNNEELTEKLLHTLPKGAPIDADEAVKILFRMRWYDQAQIYLQMLYKVCRKENKISLFCIPRFTDFNRRFAQDRIFLWVDILERGHAVVLGKELAPFVEDPWHFKENLKTWEKMTSRIKVMDMTTNAKLAHLRKSRNYMGEVHYPRLPEFSMKIYEELAGEHKYAFEEGALEPQVKQYREQLVKSVKIFKEKLGWSTLDIEREVGISERTAASYLHQAGVQLRPGRPPQKPIIK